MDQHSNVNLQVVQGDFPIKSGPKILKHPWSKKHQKVPKLNKKPYPPCPTPPGLIHILEINNIHNKEFFLSTCDDLPPSQRLSTFVDNLPFFLPLP